MEATTTAKAKRTLVYETEPCTRCAGSGLHSFNRRTGTNCFKCGDGKVRGTGLQVTRVAAASREQITARLRELTTVKASEIRVGDFFRVNERDRWDRVVEIEIEAESGVVRTLADGTRVPYLGLVVARRGLRSCVPADYEVRRSMDSATREGFYAWAATLPGISIETR